MNLSSIEILSLLMDGQNVGCLVGLNETLNNFGWVLRWHIAQKELKKLWEQQRTWILKSIDYF